MELLLKGFGEWVNKLGNLGGLSQRLEVSLLVGQLGFAPLEVKQNFLGKLGFREKSLGLFLGGNLLGNGGSGGIHPLEVGFNPFYSGIFLGILELTILTFGEIIRIVPQGF